MKKAERAALRILDENDAFEVPVPVEQLARTLGADIRRQPFKGDVSGMLLRDGRRVVIGLNEGHLPTRQRFSIAHELGHLVLHRGKPLFVDHTIRMNLRDSQSATGTEAEEVEANAFAAQLLMPETLVRDAVDELRTSAGTATDSDLVAQLATLFEVSSQAMSFRLINLGVIDPT